MKKFDFKQFLFEKGERVGLWTCVGLMALLVLTGGYSALNSASPTQTADEITKEADRIDNELQSGQGPAYTPPLLASEKIQYVQIDKVRTGGDFFTPSTLEDNKRRNPKILEPVEFHAAATHALVRNLYITGTNKDDLGVVLLVPKEEKKPTALTTKEKRRVAALAKLQQFLIASGGAAGTTDGMSSPGLAPAPSAMPTPEGMGATDPMMAPGAFGTDTATGKKVEYNLQFYKFNDKITGHKIAEIVKPYRMVVISGSFPYKQQLEEYRRAMKQKTTNELIAERDYIGTPQFLGFDVERQTLRADGTVVTAWQALAVKEDYKRVLMLAVSTEPDDPELMPMMISGLIMPRPVLARGTYPKPELPKIEATRTALKEALKASVPTVDSPLNRRLRQDFDIFDPVGGIYQGAGPDGSMIDPMTGRPTTGTGTGTTGTGTATPGDMTGTGYPMQEVWVPEYSLIRFIDVTTKPGFTYQYRMRIRVANPNYGMKNLVVSESLAKIKELTSNWKEIPDLVTIPDEASVYAVEKLKSRKFQLPEATAVEFHNWMERIQLKPGQRATEFPLGEWVVAQMDAYRGEFIGRQQNIEVPLWFPAKESFDFPLSTRTLPGGKREKGIPVDFTTDNILVDFEGGSIQSFKPAVTDQAPTELLVLTANGKLVVRNSKVDIADPERVDREKEVEKTREKVKADREKQNKPVSPMDATKAMP